MLTAENINAPKEDSQNEGDKETLVDRLICRQIRKAYGKNTVPWTDNDKEKRSPPKHDTTIKPNANSTKRHDRRSVNFNTTMNTTQDDLLNFSIDSQHQLDPLANHFSPRETELTVEKKLNNLYLQYNIFVEQINQTSRENTLSTITPALPSTSFNNSVNFDNAKRQQIDFSCKTKQLLRGYDLKFGRNDKDDAESFITKLKTVQELTNIAEKDLLRFMPSMLTGDAEIWAEPLYTQWDTLEKFIEDLRLQYGIPNFQMRLEDEIRNRTQGPDEKITTFIAKIRLLMNKISPQWSEKKQLNRIYENLHPKYLKNIKRSQFNNFKELTLIGQEAESLIDKEQNYKPPPTERSLVPKAAYASKKNNNNNGTKKNEIAAIENKNLQKYNKPPNNNYNENYTSRSFTNNYVKKNNSTASNENRQQKPAQQTAAPANDRDKPKRDDNCWICKASDHWAMLCPNKDGDICYRCRTKGFRIYKLKN
uniref:Ty3 transposon capsid-like protein domain-containing protein n=1 Tax=Trichogramma kaykai TaxID=54128 RepID=A0ABD2WGX5_9HYME